MSIPRLKRFAIGVASILLGSCHCGTSTAPVVVTGPVDLIVNFSGGNSSDRPLLLYSGRRDGTCRSYEAHVGSPSITLTQVLWDSSCPVELTVFTRGYGSYVRAVAPGSADETWWTGVLASGSVELPLPALLSVPVTVWIVAATSADRMAAETRFSSHRSVTGAFATLGPGIDFNFAMKYLDPSAIPHKCTAADATTISSNPAVYDATRLNVYYLPEYADNAILYGETCWKYGHQEITMISWKNGGVPPQMLAHEMGHALGLYRPKGSPDNIGGHTDQAPDGMFSEYNLMYQWPMSLIVKDIGIGQSYALNYSDDSWLNGPLSGMARPVHRACQDSWDSGVCPRLSLNQTGWP